MPEKILESVINGQLDLQLLLKWLQGDNLEEVGEECILKDCSRTEFTAYFLSYLRTETYIIVENESGLRPVGVGSPAGTDTEPDSSGRVHRRAASDPTAGSPARPHHSPSREKKRAGRKVKTKLFTDDKCKESSPDDGRLAAGIDRLAIATSTPVKSDVEFSSPRADISISPAVTPNESRGRYRHETTFGDYLTTASKTKKKKNRTSGTSDESQTSLDTSSESLIKKSSSLRSEKRRIKPTNIDLTKKSISLNNFNSEFHKVTSLALEDNEVFSAPPLLNAGGQSSSSPAFSSERDAIRRERHRVLEKFTSLSAATSPKCSTPVIKVSLHEENFILPDISQVTSEDKIEILVKIYQTLLDTNLVLCYTSELCFLLALVRGKQKVGVESDDKSVLKSVHNAACFAVRVLKSQKVDLCVILDRPSLRALGEAKATRTMAPDLAKSLLDVYGLLGEPSARVNTNSGAELPAARVVAWNADTDGADNFPSAHSFHSFKKQRDMFYDIARWWYETGGAGAGGGAGGGGVSLRARVRTLVGAGAGAGAAGGAANCAHLGVLVARHARQAAAGDGQESRISKLKRRLTRPATYQASSLFTSEEEFYRELLTCTENEPFRACVRDALATELIALDSSPVHTGAGLAAVWRVSCSLARLLGLLAALPYCPHPSPPARPAPPSRPHRAHAHMRATRTYLQPAIDLHTLATLAARHHRLCVCVPWLCAYLCVQGALDPVALALPSARRLLALLLTVHRRRLSSLPHRTAVFLRCTLSTLFAHQNIPLEILYEEANDELLSEIAPVTSSGPDVADLITETELGSMLGFRKELASILAGGGHNAGGGRHVTPLRVGPTPNRATQRYTIIQKRLEEAVIRGCGGAGARRVLELVCERVASRAVSLTTRLLAPHRHATAVCCASAPLLGEAHTYTAQLIQSALEALLSDRAGFRALCALAERAVRARLARHAPDHNDLCEPAAAAFRQLVSSNWTSQPSPASTLTPTTHTKRGGTAAAILDLKEYVCLTLEGTPPSESELCAVLGAAELALGAMGDIGAKGAKKAILQLSVELCVALACVSPRRLSAAVVSGARRVWAARSRPPRAPSPSPSPQGLGGEDSRAPTPESDGDIQPPGNFIIAPTVHTVPATPPANDKGADSDSDELSSVFASLVSPLVVHRVSRGGGESWDALQKLVVTVVEDGWLTTEQLTECCVALYRRDWPQEVVGPLGGWLRGVGEATGGGTALFIRFLGEYCDDLALNLLL